MDGFNTIFIAAGIWNAAVFVLYGIDKRRAKRNRRRFRESTLLLAAALMGGLGAWLGMYSFRHKTKHAMFKIGVPLLLIVNIAAAAVVLTCLGRLNEPVQYRKIMPEAAKAMMDQGNATVLDVRTQAEFAEGYIVGAVLIPDTMIAELAPGLLPDKNQVILVYCRSGNRSARAVHTLIELGYTRVYDFGGISDWPYGTVRNAT